MRLHVMPTISTFSECEAFYANARQWRDPPHPGARKIDRAGKDYKSVRPVNDGYAWRYHNTDVVVWHSEDHLTLTPWASMSTTSFMDALLPVGVTCNMHHPMGCMVGVRTQPEPEYVPDDGWGNRYQRYSQSTRWFLVAENQPISLDRVDGQWVVEHETIHVPVVDRKLAREASKAYGLPGLRAWLRATLAISGVRTVKDGQAYAERALGRDGGYLAEDIHPNSDIGLDHLREALLKPELYWEIMASPHLRPPQRYTRGGSIKHRYPEEELADWEKTVNTVAQLAAYRALDVVKVKNVTHLTGYDECDLVHRQQQRWEIDRFKWETVDA